MKLLKAQLCLIVICPSNLIIIDSWELDDFDKSHNCEDESLMSQYNSDSKRCARLSKGKDVVQLEECKKKLTFNLVQSCKDTEISVILERFIVYLAHFTNLYLWHASCG